MYCPNCGNEIDPSSKYCGSCGLPVSAADSQNDDYSQQASSSTDPYAAGSDPQDNPEQYYEAQDERYYGHDGQPGPDNNSYQYAQSPNYNNPDYQNPSYQNQAPAGYPYATQNPYPQSQYQVRVSCLGAGWKDIVHSPGWVARILLLMIMSCVPVLNFYVSGYALKWGADAARGERKSLPRNNFDKNTLLSGVYYAILSIILVIANVWMLAVASIPVVGIIIDVVVDLFATVFISLAAVRMVLYKAFGEAFELSAIFNGYGRKLGSLFAAGCVPTIIIDAICIVIAFICFLIVVNFASGALYYSAMSYSYSYDYDIIDSILSLLGGSFFLILFIYFLFLFLGGFAQVWTMRAVGHWIDRYAPDWVEEAKDSTGSLAEPQYIKD
ncbi:MAG: zinc-ribbon domain-containing protein [Eggerthellaceae bacterium]|nr:zinc-ribbon domain-containing protein [Eggerthellaceae bacterium]